MLSRPAVPFVPYAAVSIAYVVGILTGAVAFTDAMKTLLMPALILGFALALVGRRRQGLPDPGTGAVVLTFAGLVLSWLGDVLLGPSFVLGLAFFLAAHICYIVLFWTAFRRRPSRWGLLALPWFAALLWLLAPSLGDLLPVVALYGAVLGFMAVSATRGNLLTILGGVLFVVSDSLLAFRLFTPLFQTPPEDAFIMVAYLLAQGFIVAGILRRSDVVPAPAQPLAPAVAAEATSGIRP